jgi:glyoxylase-like metal-dependent hydrolase (beta-lactamase superfamily II)
MPFLSLEALRARHGDCLLVHYGSASTPRLMLVDGGPATVWGATLKPRLEQLRARYQDEHGVLRLALAMVSHIDDDHVQGMLDLTSELLEADERGRSASVRAETLWHNSFEDLTGDGEVLALVDEAEVQRLSNDPTVTAGVREGAAIVASVAQGRRLRDHAELLGWPLNRPFAELVVAPESGGQAVQLDDETRLVVLAPSAERVQALREEWEEQLRRLRASADEASVAAYIDKSVFNLSSIVCLVEAHERRMLLTGDARGDDILAALGAAGLMENGGIAVDVFKLPHHGSDRNVAPDLFARVVADHYVVSGDGRHGNPELATLQMLCDARPDDDFTLHLTYREGPEGLAGKLDNFLAAERAAGRSFRVLFREEAALSLGIDLLDPLPP